MTIRLMAAASTLAVLAAAPALAEPVRYELDPGHSQILFSWDHLGFSTTTGVFSGFEGEILFDAEAPEASSVRVEFPVSSMFTGWEERDAHFMSADFFDAAAEAAESGEMVTFESTAIEVTGDDTAQITGDLTLNGVTQEVVLDTTLNSQGTHPMVQTPWMGLSATTSVLRSDFGVGAFAPAVSDEVQIEISIEAGEAAADDES